MTAACAQQPLFDLGHPSMPVLDLARCHTKPISHLTAARMVERYHYAHRVPAISLAVGLYVDDVLAGCLTYGTPAVPNVQRACGEEFRTRSLELNRLFIHDWAGRNSESYLIKHRYVQFLGDRRLKRTLRAALRWPVLPYPKAVPS